MKDYTKIAAHLPVIPLRKTVLFPKSEHELLVSEITGHEALERAASSENFVLAVCADPDFKHGELEGLARTGALVRIASYAKKVKGYMVRMDAVERVELAELAYAENEGYRARYEIKKDDIDIDENTQKALFDDIRKLSLDILTMISSSGEAQKFVENIQDLRLLLSLVATRIALPWDQKQELLEIESLKSQGLRTLDLLSRQKESLKIQLEMSRKVSDSTSRMQRESILREQMKAIKAELNKNKSGGQSLRERFDDKYLTDEALEAVNEELDRLEVMSENSPEYGMLRNYLEFILALPWEKAENQENDLAGARRILEEDHYGLEKIKERIIQHLAVLKLRKEKHGTILMFVGPPGTGKTSLGKSIARALGRKFIRASLGGIRDEAEIRGHRRTYIGSLPGRILQGMKKAGTTNPVFLLDEIDKLMSGGWSGDPASALLEVLDPEQNNTFRDNYLDIPYDLSDVFFIATANSLENVTEPLRDRMEIIRLSGYTENEKYHIAVRHLLPELLDEFGIGADRLEIRKSAMEEIVSSYTREAGVRELKRKIAAICRVSAAKIIEGKEKVVISRKNLPAILGKAVYTHEQLDKVFPPGVVTGLAWTPAGGEILFVETSSMPGKGEFTLTGQLGDVMKESARIALSLVRGRIPLSVPHFNFNEEDIHIHVPSGAIPKDGPSAGIAILTSIASMVSGRPVRPKLAMTGEITLRGSVMPVGGIKEKFLAAYRAGVEEVIVSEKNMRDLDDIPKEILKKLAIHRVSTVVEVIKIALNLDFHPDWENYSDNAGTGKGKYIRQSEG